MEPPGFSLCQAYAAATAGALGEQQASVETTSERYPSKAAAVEAWIDRVARLDVLALDGTCFRVRPELMHRQPDDLVIDALIAATASVRDPDRRDPQRSGFPAAWQSNLQSLAA